MKLMSAYEFFQLETKERQRLCKWGSSGTPVILEDGEYTITEHDGEETYAVVYHTTWGSLQIERFDGNEWLERERAFVADAQLEANLSWELDEEHFWLPSPKGN